MPRLRRSSTAANGRDSGAMASEAATRCMDCSSHEPWWGEPRHTTWRRRSTQCACWLAASWAAERATRPPIEWPTSAMSWTGTGQAATSSSTSAAMRCPFSRKRASSRPYAATPRSSA